MSSNNTIFIPFGHRCSSKGILDRCHLSGQSLPFDSVVCQLSVIKDCLENDFKEFLNINNYIKVNTMTVNMVDGVVLECCCEMPSVNRYYEGINKTIADEDLTNTSTYHLQLALTHHDLSLTQDYETYTRRIGRLYEVLKQSRKKIYVYIHPIIGINDYNKKNKELIDEFTSFSELIAKRCINIFGLFIILVKLREGIAAETSIRILKNNLCCVYVIYANKDFIDAGGPFSGNCEQEIKTMTDMVQQSDFFMGSMYKIYFPLFDHIESASNEMRLTHEGLTAHPQVTLVDSPENADYLIFCQNHLVDHCPFHTWFNPIKDKYKEKTILLDYDDNPDMIYDAGDFRWRLYFKRSCVNRENGRIMDYASLPVLPTAYCVVNDMCEPPIDYNNSKNIDISCLFDDDVIDSPWFKLARGRLLKFAKRLADNHRLSMQIGTVSECGSVGRSGINSRYKQCLYDSKIILHANPDPWEGDARLWEALASGALVFVDRMYAPIKNPLIDGQHLIFYDLTDEGMSILERKIIRFLTDDKERQKIGMQGREFVMNHHRSIHRVSEIIRELENTSPLPTGSTKIASELDIIVSIATGYKEIDQYRQFISTLRRTGATCPVLLGISDGPEYEPVKRYLLDNAVNYFIVPPISPLNKVVNGYRFEQYRQWLKDLDFRYALMMDFRDAYFQRDPFTDVENFMQDCDLYLMSEFQFLTVGNHPNGMNCSWIEKPFGKQIADAIADSVILNSGAIMGSRKAVMAFLEIMAEVTVQQNFEFADQGTLNYLAHGGHLEHCGRTKITRAGKSVVNNCGFTEIDLLRKIRPITADEEALIAFIPRDEQGRLKLYRDHDGWVLDDDGNISYAVHQYDRFALEMDTFVSRLSDYECPDHVFINSGKRRYRGEKYTLSSRVGLKPDAVHRLIRKIKSMPVDKKPLLLVNAGFKRGFVFAYGTLNIELLFESEAFRQKFFEPTIDPKKCQLFCQKWGYEAIFVEENEIFLSSEVRPNLNKKTAQDFREASVQADRWVSP